MTFVGQAGTVSPTLAVHVSRAQSTLTIGGPAGGNYTIWDSADLMHWSSLLATNFPIMPTNWTDPSLSLGTAKYYRVSLAQ